MNNAVYGEIAPAETGFGLVTMLQFGGGDTGDVIGFQMVGRGTTTSGTIKGSIHDPASVGFAVVVTSAMVGGYPVQAVDPDGLGAYAGVQLLLSKTAAPT